jgi:hypothetical protein|tara:strand:- start:633 stop:1037 length:405 start_codon:yes stop_codon:yes gene_type:complete
MQNISREDRAKIDDFARLSILKSIFVKEWQETSRKELTFMSGKYMGFLLGDEFQFSHKKRQGGLSQSKMTTFIKEKFGFTDDQMKEMFGSETTINVFTPKPLISSVRQQKKCKDSILRSNVMNLIPNYQDKVVL